MCKEIYGSTLVALQDLAGELSSAYAEWGQRLEEALEAVDETVRAIAIPYPADANFVFAGAKERNTFITYTLCVARVQEHSTSYAISVSRYTHKPHPTIPFYETIVLSPGKIPFLVRVHILDVLPQFMEAYEKHARDTTAFLLSSTQ